jgi:DNA-binding LacI/PurR family transcriptional regulator
VLYSMISAAEPAQRDIVLPTQLIPRESCGCRPDPVAPEWRLG